MTRFLRRLDTHPLLAMILGSLVAFVILYLKWSPL